MRVAPLAVASAPAPLRRRRLKYFRRSRFHGYPSLIISRRGLKDDEGMSGYALGLGGVEVVKLNERCCSGAGPDDEIGFGLAGCIHTGKDAAAKIALSPGLA